MFRTRLRAFVLIGAAVAASFIAGRASRAQNFNRVFEIRTYTTADGRLDALLARFRDHTMTLFEKHNMVNVGYWVPQDPPKSHNTLIYILAHHSREDAANSWKAFNADPEWQKVRAQSEASGPIVTHVDSVFANPTDFSPLQ